MAIQHFFNGATREFAYQNYPVAMASACIALDATAKQECSDITKVGERCKWFVNQYLDIISVIGTGGGTCAMPGSQLNSPDPLSLGSYVPLPEIIYKSIRCQLIHEASLAARVSFTNDAFLGVRGGRLEISTRMIVALLAAVAASPTNEGLEIDENWIIYLDGRVMPFAQIAGNPRSLRDWLGIPLCDNTS